MDNITLETTNFSDQLGLYDFFDVIVSGAVFVFGISALSIQVYSFLWENTTVVKGLGIVLLVYISGVVLQEIGSILDRHLFRIKHFTRSTFLFDIGDVKTRNKLNYWFWSPHEKKIKCLKSRIKENRTIKSLTHNKLLGKIKANLREEKTITSKQQKSGKWNWVLNNPYLLNRYRNLSMQIYKNSFKNEDFKEELYHDEEFNSFVFSVIQYSVSCQGKDKKVEKLRALYSLARTLMICFGIFFIIILGMNWCEGFSDLVEPRCKELTNVFFFASPILTILFFFRMKKCKKYMALIMLGNYDAGLQTSKEGTLCYRMATNDNSTLSESKEKNRV